MFFIHSHPSIYKHVFLYMYNDIYRVYICTLFLMLFSKTYLVITQYILGLFSGTSQSSRIRFHLMEFSYVVLELLLQKRHCPNLLAMGPPQTSHGWQFSTLVHFLIQNTYIHTNIHSFIHFQSLWRYRLKKSWRFRLEKDNLIFTR